MGLFGWLWLSLSLAHAAVIQSVDSSLQPIANGPTLTIRDLATNEDITGTWLPTWRPGVPEQVITIRYTPVSSATEMVPTSIQVLPQTSTWPGNCTNYGSNTDTSLDVAAIQPDKLMIKDCGAKAVIILNGDSQLTFVVPADSDPLPEGPDGMPDIWEQQESATLSSTQCPNRATCLLRNADNEMIGANLNLGDGWANIDEYRGFIVNGMHVRTKTTQKDVFEILVNPQCSKASGTTAPTGGLMDSLIGKGSGETRLIYPIDGTPLFNNVLNLGGSSTPIADHLLGYQEGGLNPQNTAEWVDNFAKFENGQIVYKPDTDGSISDRQVNQNAIEPIRNAIGNPIKHKAVRIIECVDNFVFSPLGLAIFPPGIQVGNPDLDTNSIVYTQRIWHDYERVLNIAGSKGGTSQFKACALDPATTCVYYQTYTPGFTNNGTPTITTTTPTKTFTLGGTTRNVNRDYIVSKYIQWVLAMEKGHSFALIPEIQIAEYGPHFAPGSGDNLDQRVIVKDSSKLGGVIYSIPAVFLSKSNDCFQLKTPTGTQASSCQ